jgi:mRNA interferase MazF
VEEKYTKNFTEWFQVKEKLESNSYIPVVMNGDIWSLHVGINLGSEIDGKGDRFTRPVYVLHRVSKESFIGIPLTSKQKDSIHRIGIENEESYLSFSQIKTFSSKRCKTLLKSLPDEEQKRIRTAFHKIFCT